MNSLIARGAFSLMFVPPPHPTLSPPHPAPPHRPLAGVYRMPNGRWRAQITYRNKVIQVGMFDGEEEVRPRAGGPPNNPTPRPFNGCSHHCHSGSLNCGMDPPVVMGTVERRRGPVAAGRPPPPPPRPPRARPPAGAGAGGGRARGRPPRRRGGTIRKGCVSTGRLRGRAGPGGRHGDAAPPLTCHPSPTGLLLVSRS